MHCGISSSANFDIKEEGEEQWDNFDDKTGCDFKAVEKKDLENHTNRVHLDLPNEKNFQHVAIPVSVWVC